MKRKHYLIILLICFAMISFILCQWGGNFGIISINQFQMFSQYRYATLFILYFYYLFFFFYSFK